MKTFIQYVTQVSKMDNVDKKIISILQQDGRTSLSSIGKQLGMSHVAVKKRLDNLCDNLVGRGNLMFICLLV